MGARSNPTLRKRGATFAALVCVAVALLMAAPVGAWAAPANATGTATPSAGGSGGFTANATWNGANIETASTSGSAFQIQFNGVVNILYRWSSGPAGVSYLVNDARLQIFYFGFALATRDIVLTVGETSGQVVMNWTTGPLQYILAGSYQLTASLLTTNSTTAWSQSFWVDVAAPFYVLAILPIVLILIFVYELYAVATVGRQAALMGPKKGGGSTPPAETSPPPATPPSTPTDSTPTTPAAGADAPASPPAGGTG